MTKKYNKSNEKYEIPMKKQKMEKTFMEKFTKYY